MIFCYFMVGICVFYFASCHHIMQLIRMLLIDYLLINKQLLDFKRKLVVPLIIDVHVGTSPKERRTRACFLTDLFAGVAPSMLIIFKTVRFLILRNPCMFCPCPLIDSIIRLMTVWRITGKIIITTIMLIHMHYACV